MSKTHLTHSPSPLPQGKATQALCGEVIPEAQFAFLWDETAMGAGIGESLNSLRVCGKCVKAAEKTSLGTYIYGLTRPQKQAFREAVSE
jgi:hypothetical protein